MKKKSLIKEITNELKDVAEEVIIEFNTVEQFEDWLVECSEWEILCEEIAREENTTFSEVVAEIFYAIDFYTFSE